MYYSIHAAKRRNKWICALKQAMAEVHVHGPSGDPAARPRVKPYTLVPWDEVKDEDERLKKEEEKAKDTPSGQRMPLAGWNLSDNNPMSSASFSPRTEFLWTCLMVGVVTGSERRIRYIRRGVRGKDLHL